MLLLVVLSLDCGTDGWTTARRLNSPLRCHSVCGLTQNRGPRAAGKKKKAACARARAMELPAHPVVLLVFGLVNDTFTVSPTTNIKVTSIPWGLLFPSLLQGQRKINVHM